MVTESKPIREREIRAHFDSGKIRIYQAFSAPIADAALRAQRFVPPFKRTRMTWIKPSFAWMMYRSGWGEKIGQERILGIELSREGFEWALGNSCLTQFDAGIHGNSDSWKKDLADSPVRIQWDPERNVNFEPLKFSTIQFGLGPEVVEAYIDEWIKVIEDLTPLTKTIKKLVQEGEHEVASSLFPKESIYPLSESLSSKIGIR